MEGKKKSDYLDSSRRYFSISEQLCKLPCGEVANTNVLSQPQPVAFLHAFPNRLQVEGENVVALYRRIGFSSLQSHGPMYEVEIKVIQFEIPNTKRKNSIRFQKLQLQGSNHKIMTGNQC